MTALPHSPAADRNKQPILDSLRAVLPASDLMLEIASGTGQHAAWFAAGLPQWQWQPTDAEASALPAIAPWATCAALMQGSARHLAPGGVLITYGPYLEDDVPTAPGNVAFDASLRERDPGWGIRRLEDVQAQAALAGLQLRSRHAMPSNNLLLVWAAGT